MFLSALVLLSRPDSRVEQREIQLEHTFQQWVPLRARTARHVLGQTEAARVQWISTACTSCQALAISITTSTSTSCGASYVDDAFTTTRTFATNSGTDTTTSTSTSTSPITSGGVILPVEGLEGLGTKRGQRARHALREVLADVHQRYTNVLHGRVQLVAARTVATAHATAGPHVGSGTGGETELARETVEPEAESLSGRREQLTSRAASRT